MARRLVTKKNRAYSPTQSRALAVLERDLNRKVRISLSWLFLSLILLAFLLGSINLTYGASGRTVIVYTPKDQMIAQWKALCDAHPAWASYESIGKSVQCRDIWLFKIGNPTGGKVMYDGEAHGPEDSGTETLYKFCKWLLESNDPLANHILQWNYHLIIPILNIDTTRRTNMRRQYTLPNGTVIDVLYGVDLNRNGIYGWGQTGSANPTNKDSYRGLYAGSEPETIAYNNAVAKYKPDIYCNTHTGQDGLYHVSNTPLEAKVLSLKAQYEAQYGVTNPYYGGQFSAGGYIETDVDECFNVSGWMWEMCTWANLKPTLSEWLTTCYPRVFPVFLAFAKAVEKAPQTPQYIFQDGFENGLTKWTTETYGAGSAPTTQNGTFRSGAFAVTFNTQATKSFAMSMIGETISGRSSVYVRAYYYVDSSTLSLMGADDRFYILRLTANDQLVASLGLRREGTMPVRWCIWRATSGTAGTHTYGQTQNVASVPKWTCIEFMWDKTTSSIKVWINGNLEFQETGNWTGVADVNEINVGIYKSGTSGSTYDPTTALTCKVYVDDLIIDEQYIAP